MFLNHLISGLFSDARKLYISPSLESIGTGGIYLSIACGMVRTLTRPKKCMLVGKEVYFMEMIRKKLERTSSIFSKHQK